MQGDPKVIRKNVERCLEQLTHGRAIILYDDMDREGEGDLAFAAKFCTPATVNLALTIARGLLCISMSPEISERIGVLRLESNNKDPFATPFGMPISLANGGSGVSAKDRCDTILATCRPDAKPSDFCTPGHVSTLIAHPHGLAGRLGHTEAVLELLKVAGIPGCGVLCEILDPDGTVAGFQLLKRLSHLYDMPVLNISEIMLYDRSRSE